MTIINHGGTPIFVLRGIFTLLSYPSAFLLGLFLLVVLPPSAAGTPFTVASSCDGTSFTVNYNNTQCWGLQSANVSTIDECIAACCALGLNDCQTWQWCPANAPCVQAGNPPNSCWIGLIGNDCRTVNGWIGNATGTSPPANKTDTFHITLPVPPLPSMIPAMGNATSPAGDTITFDSQSLMINDQGIILTMGECQFSRQPDVSEWRANLLTMKAGGLNTVGTYVFWIHHEEINGTWRFDDFRDLRTFVQIAGEVGLQVFVRAGPWAHGECRNGGFPDWLQHSGIPLRSTDPRFVSLVTELYSQIHTQLDGYYYSQGGPVVGIQIDNEYSGSWEYLDTLKNVSIQQGINVPFYTRTGWPPLNPAPPLPPRNYSFLLPFFGGYADGFWDRTIGPVDSYLSAFVFNLMQDPGYPTLSVELGGGMTSSYHRRILMFPDDMGALGTVALGSGTNSLGYYIYHGGTHPIGQLSTLQESQLSGYPNDLAMRDYSFYAPISEFGNIRGHYHLLRRLHLLVDSWSSTLARMPVTFPDTVPSSYTDTSTLRWTIRSNGTSGFIFVNQYQRHTVMSNVTNVKFNLTLSNGNTFTVPQVSSPNITVPAGKYFVWPFNLPIDNGNLNLRYATAMPLSKLRNADGSIVMVLGNTATITSEMVIEATNGGTVTIVACTGAICTPQADGSLLIHTISTGNNYFLQVQSSVPSSPVVSFVLFDEPTSIQLYTGTMNNSPCWVLADGPVLFDPAAPSAFRIRTENSDGISFAVYPAYDSITYNGQIYHGTPDGIFMRYTVSVPSPQVSVSYTLVQPAGPPRTVPLGPAGVAEAPDADGSTVVYANASIYNLTFTLTNSSANTLPPNILPRVIVNYTGDCARIYYNQTILHDNFYNGDLLQYGLHRLGSSVWSNEGTFTVQLYILPLSSDAPIYLYTWPDFNNATSILRVDEVSMAQMVDATFTVSA